MSVSNAETLKDMLVVSSTAYGSGIAISPDGKTLAISYDDGRMALLDIASGKQKAQYLLLHTPATTEWYSNSTGVTQMSDGMRKYIKATNQ